MTRRRTHGFGVLLAGAVAGSALYAACGQTGTRGEFADDPGAGGGNGEAGTDPGLGGGPGFDSDAATVRPATALTFVPEARELTIDDGEQLDAAFALRATFEDGTSADVSAQSLEFDRPDLAALTNGVPVSARTKGRFAGTGRINAVYGGKSAQAALRVRIRTRDTNGVGPSVLAAFDALDAALAAGGDGSTPAPNDPTVNPSALLYPYDGTVFPLGLATPHVMWTTPAAGDIYRLRFEEADYRYDYFFTTVSTAPDVQIPQIRWDRLTASNRGPDDPLRVTLSRYAPGPNEAYLTASHSWTIAPASARGAIYYWTAKRKPVDGGFEDIGAITRIQPGTGSTPQALNEGRCMGCHAVSANGTVMTATVEDRDYQTVPPYQHVFDTAGGFRTRALAAYELPSGNETLKTTKSGGFSALSPDGTFVVFGAPSNTPVAGSKYLSLARTAQAGGPVIATSGLDDAVFPWGMGEGGPSYTAPSGLMMPAFSPDGTKVAFVQNVTGWNPDNVIPSQGTDPANQRGLVYLDFDAANERFNPQGHVSVRVTDLPDGSKEVGYPSFSPDSHWVAFSAGPTSTGCFDGPVAGSADNCNDYTPDRGDIWLGRTAGGAPVRLGRLNDLASDASVGQLNREPTFNPAEAGGYFWVVFTSMRKYGHYNGHESNPSPFNTQPVNLQRRLWVAALSKSELDALRAGTFTGDPSRPPFYLDGQTDVPNMRGFWALAACIPTPTTGTQGQSCTAGVECCSGFCDDGQCVEPSRLACVPVQGACITAADCCNTGSVQCRNGACTVVVN
jgi:hypothetical protein